MATPLAIGRERARAERDRARVIELAGMLHTCGIGLIDYDPVGDDGPCLVARDGRLDEPLAARLAASDLRVIEFLNTGVAPEAAAALAQHFTADAGAVHLAGLVNTITYRRKPSLSRQWIRRSAP